MLNFSVPRAKWSTLHIVPEQNGWHFADSIFKAFSWKKGFVFWIEFQWSLFQSYVSVNQLLFKNHDSGNISWHVMQVSGRDA